MCNVCTRVIQHSAFVANVVDENPNLLQLWLPIDCFQAIFLTIALAMKHCLDAFMFLAAEKPLDTLSVIKPMV